MADPRHVNGCFDAEEFEQVELEMFSQCASPLVSKCLIKDCVVSLEPNRRRPPKVQAKALNLKNRKGHQAGP
ncbi:hypothetical protein PBY51_015372 [Eleginops maclovinus]|uniref:Uncharacterized protein n=1 Tax=Eleginops maclovinus TaxID=56733 RepID=A0AAN8AGF9_ELEMC|nr:hypothetical protein PBY51_015372 [Eleginops maclovinus]